jgi:hypothetical protein
MPTVSTDDQLRTLLAQPMPDTIAEAVARMKAIENILGPHDGLYPFTLLYRLTTEAVGAKPDTFWEDPKMLARLDVYFAEAFFDALRRWLGPDPESAPSAWKVLFRARHTADISKLRRALAGMNAHINRDLGECLTQVWAELGKAPDDGTAMHRDFERVNEVLAETEPVAKQKLFERWLREIEEAVGEVDDLLALWSIDKARDLAWTNGQAQFALRDAPALREKLLSGTDKMAGFLGSLILGV